MINCLFPFSLSTSHFPLQINPARRAALTLLSTAIDAAGYQLSGEALYRRYLTITSVLLLAALLLALIVHDFGLVLEVIGESLLPYLYS